ncbi:MAG: primosomal protein N' [Nitratireductor sp.]|nr:primosomal protein N' [Nitratireductor sp.]
MPPVPENVVPVLLPIPADRPYSYAVPEGMKLVAGDIVAVPLGPRTVIAAVWDGETDNVDPGKLREIEGRFDCPPLDAAMRRFVDWVANYCLAPPGMVLKMVLRAPGALVPLEPMEGIVYSGREPERMTKAREAVLDLARDGLAWTRSGLAHAAGVSSGVVDGLMAQAVLSRIEIPAPPVVAPPDPDHATTELSDGQAQAADALRKAVEADGFSATLLEGVTGSGKTEVYFEAVAAALKKGRQVLILLPEIALTAAFLERFEQRFGAKPAEWHSDVSPKRREQVWRQVATGEVRVVAGARSALFLPFEELGLVVIDEEHDPAYKQEDRVFYHARDMAVVRANLTGVPAVLVSATPSIESRVNAEAGKYGHIRLAERYAAAELPEIKVIDMRRSGPARGSFISPVLIEAMKQTLEKKQQSLLFLNRRGYAPLTLCRVCGHRFQCPDCSAWLVEHRFRRQLVCHHCGHSEPVPEACPECGALDHLVACGPGVERLAEEVLHHFPDARTIVLSSDLLGGVSRLRLELEAIAKGEVDIVIGTQLVAKGHNFPAMTCVGVIDADLGLANGDPRAAERTFQLLAQVTGRAGRTGAASTGFLQSYQPEHSVIAALAAGDSESFYAREIEARRQAALPPFGRLASVIVSAASRQEAERHAREMRRAASAHAEISVLGPAEAPMALIRGRHRFRLLVHASRRADLQGWLRQWLNAGPKARGSVRVQIDIDPQSFL